MRWAEHPLEAFIGLFEATKEKSGPEPLFYILLRHMIHEIIYF